MWDDLNGKIEESVGDININYQDCIELLSGVNAELFARVVFNYKTFNYLKEYIFCVVGNNIIFSRSL